MSRLHDDVAFGLENTGVDPASMEPLIDKALSEVSIDMPGNHPTRHLSGGQRQRVTLAGALAMTPGLLVLDEPTSALDPEGVREVISAVSALAHNRSTTLVIIDHTPSHWWGLIDTVITLADGNVVSITQAPQSGPTPQARKAGSAVVSQGLRPHDSAAGALVADHVITSRDGHSALGDAHSLHVNPGEILAITGPNGSGKTTLAMTLAGLLSPHAGSVTWGCDLHDATSKELAGIVGVVPQNPAHLFRASRVDAEIASVVGAAHAERVLEQWGLSGVGNAHPLSLSGGEKRRLALAVATAGSPKLLVLDEPSQSLDDASWHLLISQIHALQQSGVAIVMATHDLALVEALQARSYELTPLEVDSVPPPAAPSTSPLARANPLALVAAALMPAVALLSTLDVVSALVALGCVALVMIVMRPHIPQWGVRLAPIGLAALLSGVTIALYGQSSGEVLWEWWLVSISQGSLTLALATTLRILAIGVPAVVVLSRVDPTRFADALTQQAKAPENFVLGALAALRLLDVVSSDREIRGWMMRARGAGDGSALRHAFGTVVGILVSALSRSETLALAMQARGFAAQRTRTHYRRSRWTLSDTWWVIGGVAVGVLSVLVAVVTGAFNAVLA
jgi:energy-coupling factor transport system ATP-binding protein